MTDESSAPQPNPGTMPPDTAPDYGAMVQSIWASPTRWQPLAELYGAGIARTAVLIYLDWVARGGDPASLDEAVTSLALCWTDPRYRAVILGTIPDMTRRKTTDALERSVVERYAEMRRQFPYLPDVDGDGYALSGTNNQLEIPCVAVPDVQGEFPRPLIRAHNMSGAILSAGTVTLLAGAGGAAKSRLALQLAVTLAMASKTPPADTYTKPATLEPLAGAILDGRRGGPVLYLTYEDAPAVVAWAARSLAGHLDDGQRGAASEALGRVHVMGMRGRALFGPAAGGLYNARPSPLPALAQVASNAERLAPTLIVVDPALSAYVGESNAAAPVRDFLAALEDLAAPIGAGVLVLAHSNKTARGRTGNQKPDPFDAGQVGGSTHWVDGARAALSLTVEAEGRRRLAVLKSNYAESFISVPLDPIRHQSGAIIGFRAAGPWHHGGADNSEPEPSHASSRNGESDTDFGFGANLADPNNPPV